jgi:hypothetical protein
MVSLFVKKASAISSILNPQSIRNARPTCDSPAIEGLQIANIICNWLSLIFFSEKSISAISDENWDFPAQSMIMQD